MIVETLLLPLLEILSRPKSDQVMVLQDGELRWGSERIPLDGGTPSSAKIKYLLNRLGLIGIQPEQLADTWNKLLSGGRPSTPRELLAAVRRPENAGAGKEDGIVRRWRAAVEPLLRKIPAAAGAVEALESQAPAKDVASCLELQPLLEAWPRQLLMDPWWATVEAPLPNMSPLTLDEVWVDLQMLDPGEWPVLAGLENLRSLLEQRYEERRWQSEPLTFILERLSGIVAFVGPPGSGKTTLLKWIARRLIQDPGSRYLLPLFVPLRRYVLWCQAGGEPGLLRYALNECGVHLPEQKSLWLRVLNDPANCSADWTLLLLDGWDEVSVEARGPLLRELQELANGVSVLVTSRPAAFPSRLAASCVYEIADLAPDGIDALIRRSFRGTGEPGHAEDLLRHLEEHPDLRRLARNPFLLTLLCGISREARRREGLALPSTRAALYERALGLICAHHNERYPEAPLNSDRQRQIERLALWLLDDAPGAPRLLFGSGDITRSGGDPDLLQAVLNPSRLLGQLGPNDDAHHFLHTTFQEFLAAKALGQKPPGQAAQKLQSHVHETSWQEVFHFLAAEPGPLREIFWRVMSAQAARPDRFGLILVRLARWLRAAGALDGGAALLGRDLREHLWPFILQLSESRIWVEAYAELDAPGLVLRIQAAIRRADQRLRTRLQRALNRIRNPVASIALVEHILGDDPQKAAVAAAQIHLRIDRDGLNRLREAAADPHQGLSIRQRTIRALGYARDSNSLPILLQIAESVPNLAGEVACALGRIGGKDATTQLATMLERPDHHLQHVAVNALGEMRDVPSRDILLDEIARRPEKDPLVLPILEALIEVPIHHGAELILELLASQKPDIRRAAASALAAATGSGVFDGLVKAAGDPDEKVRCAALEIFPDRARPDDAVWLARRIEDDSRSSEERGFALRALLTAAGRYAHTTDVEAQWLRTLAAEQVLHALRNPEGDLALEAVARAQHAGSAVGARLIELCQDEGASPYVRELACAALGKMEFRGAVNVLLELVRTVPDADDDEDQPLETAYHRIARAAAEALTRIDPSLLLREKGSTAFYALARFAVESGNLIYEDHIVGQDGKKWAQSTSSPPSHLPSRPLRRPAMPRRTEITAVDLDIKVSERTIDGSSVLQYELSSPSGAASVTHHEVRTAPFKMPFDEYRKRILQRLEALQIGLHRNGDILPNEAIELAMRKLGQELYRQLFPTELKRLYRQWRESVRTIQISSAEWWIPWELIRPYDHDLEPVVDDDFLGARYQVTRWLIGETAPAAAIPVLRLACLEAGKTGSGSLPYAALERELLSDLARQRQVEDISPLDATVPALFDLLERGNFDLLHFVGHGEFSGDDPAESRIVLTEGASVMAGELEGPILRKISKDRPLVYLNACSTAQQGAALTSLSGWPEAWIGRGKAGAFVAPQWQVNDTLAFEFARIFYKSLDRGRTLGSAARLARWWVRRLDRLRNTWLAFVVYGHPNAQISFGSARAKRRSLRSVVESDGSKHPTGSAAPNPISTNAPLAPEIFVGRTKDLDRLKARLGVGKDGAQRSEVQILTTVRGWPGVGKTSVAAALARDPDLRSKFEGVLWASLGQEPDLLGEMTKWGRWLGSDDLYRAESFKEATSFLRTLLRERKLVIVLDDVWEAGHAAVFQRACGPACTIVATTREPGVAQLLASRPESVYQLDVLDTESAYHLLRLLAPEVVELHPNESYHLVNELECHPLAIQVAGRLLREEASLGWGVHSLLQDLASGSGVLNAAAPLDRFEPSGLALPTVSALFARSTDRLTPETRERFRLLGGFVAKPATFGIEVLRRIWQVDDPRPTLRELAQRGLLEPMGEERFQIHSLLLRHAETMSPAT